MNTKVKRLICFVLAFIFVFGLLITLIPQVIAPQVSVDEIQPTIEPGTSSTVIDALPEIEVDLYHTENTPYRSKVWGAELLKIQETQSVVDTYTVIDIEDPDTLFVLGLLGIQVDWVNCFAISVSKEQDNPYTIAILRMDESYFQTGLSALVEYVDSLAMRLSGTDATDLIANYVICKINTELVLVIAENVENVLLDLDAVIYNTALLEGELILDDSNEDETEPTDGAYIDPNTGITELEEDVSVDTDAIQPYGTTPSIANPTSITPVAGQTSLSP